ncbi:MAG: hypothetical protein JWO52_5303 [Gammaproteobacteria bacterium]|jgi:hypothetical protein|nr:hypothetical protein [Gammaproteobacteria bacterium]
MAKAKKKAAPKESQSERFIRAAIEAGVDETGKKFERVFKKIAKPSGHRSRPGGKRSSS